MSETNLDPKNKSAPISGEEKKSEKTAETKAKAHKPKPPRSDVARHPRKVKFTDRGRGIIKHVQAIAPHHVPGNQDITISGIVDRALKLLESQINAVPVLRFALLDGAELARLVEALDENWTTLRSFRADVLKLAMIKAVGSKSIGVLTSKAEAAIDDCSVKNKKIARMTQTVRAISPEDYELLRDVIKSLLAKSIDPSTPERIRAMTALAAKLLDTFILPPILL